MAKQDASSLENQLTGLMVAQGVFAVLFGIVALFWPGLTVGLLVLMFGIYLLVWAIVGLIVSLTSIGKNKFWWLEMLFSVLAVGVAVYLLRHLAVGAALFILLVGLTFLVRGVLDVVEGIFDEETKKQNMKWFRIVTGVLGIVAGAIVLSQPVAAGVAVVWIMGLYAVLYGVMVIALSIVARNED